MCDFLISLCNMFLNILHTESTCGKVNFFLKSWKESWGQVFFFISLLKWPVNLPRKHVRSTAWCLVIFLFQMQGLMEWGSLWSQRGTLGSHRVLFQSLHVSRYSRKLCSHAEPDSVASPSTGGSRDLGCSSLHSYSSLEVQIIVWSFPKCFWLNLEIKLQ